MSEPFQVAIHHDNDCGYIEYHPDTRKITVVLDDAAKRREVEAYLSRPHTIRVAETLLDFSEKTVPANESLAVLQVVLTDLWVHTEVYVDWSRPLVMPE